MGDTEMKFKGSEFNSLLLKILSGIITVACLFGGWLGKEVYAETRATHDAVVRMQTAYQIEVAELRVRISAVELEIQKMKDRRP